MSEAGSPVPRAWRMSPIPAQRYEEFLGPAIFRPLARVLLDHEPPPPGATVLDLACGTGFVAREAAPRVGGEGRIVAADISPEMLAIGRNRGAAEGAAIEWMELDATTAIFPEGHFDIAYCQQGLQFLRDRPAALDRVRHALARGGRFVAATWLGLEHQPLFEAFATIEARHLATIGIGFEQITRPFSFGDPEALRALLEEAGFDRVAVARHDLDVRFPDSATFARNMETAYAAVVPEFIADADAFERFVGAVERETRPIVERFTREGELRVTMPTNLAVGVVG